MEQFSTLVENTFSKIQQVHDKSRLEYLDSLQEKLLILDTELSVFLLGRDSPKIEVDKGK